jgi:hypothetical protein
MRRMSSPALRRSANASAAICWCRIQSSCPCSQAAVTATWCSPRPASGQVSPRSSSTTRAQVLTALNASAARLDLSGSKGSRVGPQRAALGLFAGGGPAELGNPLRARRASGGPRVWARGFWSRHGPRSGPGGPPWSRPRPPVPPRAGAARRHGCTAGTRRPTARTGCSRSRRCSRRSPADLRVLVGALHQLGEGGEGSNIGVPRWQRSQRIPTARLGAVPTTSISNRCMSSGLTCPPRSSR